MLISVESGNDTTIKASLEASKPQDQGPGVASELRRDQTKHLHQLLLAIMMFPDLAFRALVACR